MSSNSASKNNTEHRSTGFRISYINVLFIVVIMIACVFLLVILLSLSEEFEKSNEVSDKYQRINQNALIVRSASDYLTNNVQSFVITGEREYLDRYFNEANVTKRREKAIEAINSIDDIESITAYLESSVNESKKLMVLEYEAMRYAAEGYDYDISDLPEEVKMIRLPEKASEMDPEEKIKQAHNIVFGKEYNEYKDSIYINDQKFIEKADVLMKEVEESGRAEMRKKIVIQFQMLFLILLIGSLIFLTLSNLVVGPLDNAVKSIAQGKIISPIIGSYEILYMSEEYNMFHRKRAALQKQLKSSAEKDALTGLISSNGYNMVTDRLSQEKFPLALLVFKLDDYQKMLDDHGSDAAEGAVKEFGNILNNSFRDSDIISRINDDVFTVIMSNITPKFKPTIRQKFEQISEKLQSEERSEIPGISFSAGCSFSLAGYHEHLLSMAISLIQKSETSGGRLFFE